MGKTLLPPKDWRIVNADCIDAMRAMPDACVDAVVCDPPYFLDFAGEKWDGAVGFVNTILKAREGRKGTPYGQGNVFQQFTYEWGREALRVLKPGGYILAFAGSRTYHRMASGLEDAGFEIRDMLVWLHGQGFPKGANIAKNMDKASPHFEAVRQKTSGVGFARMGFGKHTLVQKSKKSKLAEDHDEQHTALKPSLEPFVMGRKPPKYKNVTQNVYHYGVGALNIKECRIPVKGEAKGRWPANVLTDGSDVVRDALPHTKSVKAASARAHAGRDGKKGLVGGGGPGASVRPEDTYSDEGSVARFFYTAKCHPRERQCGMPAGQKNEHQTVKPIAIMQFCVRLITPKGGVVLDPFAGSGSTGVAARLEGRRFLGIEREDKSAAIARSRVENFAQFRDLDRPKRKEAGTARDLAHVLQEAAKVADEVKGKRAERKAKANRRSR